MIKLNARINICIILVLILYAFSPVSGQKNKDDNMLGKAGMYKAKKSALEYLTDESVVKKFGSISDSIWSFAELGMQEFRSSAILIRALEEEGFTVEKGVAGMPTCFVATWGSGKPVIGFLGEFDALPMISQKALTPVKSPIVEGAPGHGCGHNMMGTAAVAAIIAVKRSMEQNNVPGTIKFFGSPAEETIISRPYMVRAGVFKDVDAVIDNHASSNFGTRYGVNENAIISAIFTFRGKTAHSAGAPWSGRSALDGVELMNIATNYLREHLHYTYRMHYIILEGGEAPNVVPDKASVWYYVRNTDERIEDTFKRVTDCAKGAALASGTRLDTITILTGVHQKHSNKGLAETIQRNIELIGLPEWTESETLFAKSLQKELGAKETGYPDKLEPIGKPSAIQVGGGSTDVGEVSLIAPTATLNFPGGVPGAFGHHWSTVAAGYGSAAWKGLNAGAKVIAATAMDLLTDEKLLSEIKNEFAEYSKTHPYKSFLPEGARPPLDLNKELMDKYRKAMMEVEH
ncbi:MAG TPA: amidohydrolase [Bacteroidales bacterium]|jgi:aminobenzoyl-glutamate utilization protein B|nr:amidohydrolase [Bacteroidales bacterium]HOX74124.1 amidohydrolase [Bacteroidales bacterium]HQM68323.1 amidohydrolase [Bacteroidales bacterium]